MSGGLRFLAVGLVLVLPVSTGGWQEGLQHSRAEHGQLGSDVGQGWFMIRQLLVVLLVGAAWRCVTARGTQTQQSAPSPYGA